MREPLILASASPRRRDPLANHWVVDGNLITGQYQNAAPMVARELMELMSDHVSA